jgi:hypothetical protein
MTRVDLTPAMISYGMEKKSEMDEKDNQITRLKGSKNARVNGFIAEAAVMSVYTMLEASADLSYDLYDMETGVKYDVKAQSGNAGDPKPHWVFKLYPETQKSVSDVFIFVRVDNDLRFCWILGFMYRDIFFQKAVFRPKGYVSGTVVYDDDCYEITYGDIWGK